MDTPRRPGLTSTSRSAWRTDALTFAEPLLHTIALDHAPGLIPDQPALVENAVGLALLRHYERPERLIETFVSPERLHIWPTPAGPQRWPPKTCTGRASATR